jgi:hypothetical protein
MRKILLLMLSGFVILSACGDEEVQEKEPEDEQEEVAFTDEEMELAEDMVMFANELENEYAAAANEKWEELQEENPDLYNAELSYDAYEKEERQEAIEETFYPMAKEMISEPFFEEYGEHIYLKEDELLPGFNYTQYKQDRDNSSVERDYTFYPMYENLSISSIEMKPIPELDIHELEISIDKDSTTFYKDYEADTSITEEYKNPSDKITFYKTEDDEFVIGTFPIMGEYQNEINYDSDRQIESAQELLKSLPELK